MKLFEIKDEFESDPITLDHLYKVQKACCSEFVNFLNLALSKETKKHRHRTLEDFMDDPYDSFYSPEQYNLSLRARFSLSSKVLDKLIAKFRKMLNAKQAYEAAGGNYESS